MTLDDQRTTIERALGERMLNHVFFFLRQWAKELAFAPYSDRIYSLSQSYDGLFDYYLAADDPDREAVHDKLTSETYRLVDEMYADIRIKRGLSPEMHGFNHDNHNSIMRYFSSCLHLQDEDLDWLYDTSNDPSHAGLALVAMAGLSTNLKEHFQENALLTIIDCIGSDNMVIAEQASVYSILLLAQWDLRLDFFPEVQDAFIEQCGDGSHMFIAMKALIRSVNTNLKEMVENHELTEEDLPDEIRELINKDTNEDESFEEKLAHISHLLPKTEEEYLRTIVEILPDTWVMDTVLHEEEERIEAMERLYMEVGSIDLMWARLDEAEEWLLNRLRTNRATAKDYINYAHCCFIKGDRMMAYENYREAKRICQSNRAFFDLFRPDRKMLVEKGVPLEQVYLMEDNLLR